MIFSKISKTIWAGFLVSALIGILMIWLYSKGGVDKENEMVSAYQAAYINQYEHYRSVETGLNREIGQLDEDFTREMMDAQQIIDDTLDSISTGQRKLYVNARCPKMPRTTKTAEAASVDHAASRAELDKDAAKRLIRLTDRGDKAIRQLGACQAYIRKIMEAK